MTAASSSIMRRNAMRQMLAVNPFSLPITAQLANRFAVRRKCHEP
jgi:hypothetical protein